MTDRFDDLVGQIDDPEERRRLHRVHELLLSVDAPPELSPVARPAEPARFPSRRRRPLALALVATAVGAVLFGSGYLAGGRTDDVTPVTVITMAGIGEGRGASASIDLLPQDASGNWPLDVRVRGLEPSKDRADYYELWLTKDGKLADSCGRFTTHQGLTKVTLSVPYGLRQYDGWVVTRAGSDRVLLRT
ncbi:MAG TPA: hypothetical protein VM049_12555 [Gaiellaceae bacterium]|nr:hypothetical protein [Gaiellaceae bacterium]